jgi:hypothetical protein
MPLDQHPDDPGRNSTLRVIVAIGLLIVVFVAVLIIVLNR